MNVLNSAETVCVPQNPLSGRTWTDESPPRKPQTKRIRYRRTSGLNRRRSKKKMPIAECQVIGPRSQIHNSRERLSLHVAAAKAQNCCPEQQTRRRGNGLNAQLLTVEPELRGGGGGGFGRAGSTVDRSLRVPGEEKDQRAERKEKRRTKRPVMGGGHIRLPRGRNIPQLQTQGLGMSCGKQIHCLRRKAKAAADLHRPTQIRFGHKDKPNRGLRGGRGSEKLEVKGKSTTDSHGGAPDQSES
jgi:hypothetical protein